MLINNINLNKVESVMDIYHKAISMLKLQDSGLYGLGDVSIADKASLQNTISYVESIIEKLDSREQEFLKNYFDNKVNMYWWKDKYSRASFYRLRERTLADFVKWHELPTCL